MLYKTKPYKVEYIDALLTRDAGTLGDHQAEMTFTYTNQHGTPFGNEVHRMNVKDFNEKFEPLRRIRKKRNTTPKTNSQPTTESSIA